MKWVGLLVVVLASSTSHARPAPADTDDDDAIDNKEEARTADREGRERYAAHDYAAAVDAYRRAHDALPEPLFLFDEAQAYRQLHDCAHAAQLYRAYLKDLPEADNRRRVEGFIEEMDACTPAEPLPAPAPRTAAPPPEASNDRTFAAMGIGTGVLGLFLIGTGVYFSLDASDDQTKIEAMCAKGCKGSDVQGLDLAGHSSNRNAAITYSIGGVALAAGAAMILWAEFGASGEPPAAITPVSGGAVLSRQVRF